MALTTNAGQTRGGTRNPGGIGGFTGADDPRRNNSGQRSAKAVRQKAEYREIAVGVLALPAGTPPPKKATYLQVMVWSQVHGAVKDPIQRELLLNRVYGKPTERVDSTAVIEHSGSIDLTGARESLERKFAALDEHARACDAAGEPE